MPIPVEQSHSQRQHDRLLVGVARGGGRALLGVDGVGLRTGVVAGGHLKSGGACLLIPAPQLHLHVTSACLLIHAGSATLNSRAQMQWLECKWFHCCLLLCWHSVCRSNAIYAHVLLLHPLLGPSQVQIVIDKTMQAAVREQLVVIQRCSCHRRLLLGRRGTFGAVEPCTAAVHISTAVAEPLDSCDSHASRQG